MKKKDEEEEITKVPLPKDNEVIGIVISRLPDARMLVQCKDGKERICRVPGRLRHRMWVREGDVVIVKPWELQGDKRGDIVYRYRPLEVKFLKDNKIIEL